MDGVKTKIRQYKYRLKKDYLTLGNLRILVFLLLCISWTWSSVVTMSRNWELEQTLQTKIIEQKKAELQTAKLKLEQEYYLTEEYREWVARAKLDKMAEGEKVLIMPKNSEAAKNKHKEKDGNELMKKSNFEEWVNFLFFKT